MTVAPSQVEFLTAISCTGILTIDVRDVRCNEDGKRLELVIQYVSEDGIIGCGPFTITLTGHNLQRIAFSLRLGESVSLQVRGSFVANWEAGQVER